MRIISALMLASLSLPLSAMAGKITHNIDGVGPNNSYRPVWCLQDTSGDVVQEVKYGESISTNGYVGGTLRFGGCGWDNTYLGYLGVSNGKITSYTPPAGVHIEYKDKKINSKGQLTGRIAYTPIDSNDNLLDGKTPSTNAAWPFVGVNLSGLEFGKLIHPSVMPNLSETDKDTDNSDLYDTVSLIESGVNTIRVPLRWGYIQLDGPGVGALNSEYYDNFIKPLLQTLTQAKVNTIVDLHGYMRYSKFGEGYAGCSGDPSAGCPDGQVITDENAYKDLWTKLYLQMKTDPNIDMDYIIIDIVNEPVEIPNDKVFTIQASVIKQLRDLGFEGYIAVEGNRWTGLHSWTDEGWLSDDGSVEYTNATLFSRENFNKHGITDLDKILINVHQYFDYNHSGTGATCLTDLSSRGPGKFNLDYFTDYLKTNGLKAIVTEFGGGEDAVSCSVALNKFFIYMQDNALQVDPNTGHEYGFAGWTMWSTGHGWGGYNLRVTPNSYHANVMKQYINPIN